MIETLKRVLYPGPQPPEWLVFKSDLSNPGKYLFRGEKFNPKGMPEVSSQTSHFSDASRCAYQTNGLAQVAFVPVLYSVCTIGNTFVIRSYRK